MLHEFFRNEALELLSVRIITAGDRPPQLGEILRGNKPLFLTGYSHVCSAILVAHLVPENAVKVRIIEYLQVNIDTIALWPTFERSCMNWARQILAMVNLYWST